MKRVALLGMPNTGKSTFFNRITGASARVGNWPGMTVELMTAKLLIGSSMVEFIDLPGIYDLPGLSEDEKVVERFLETMPLDLLIVVVNTTQIERQLGLLLQLRQLQLPTLVVLNMADEAQQFGVKVDIERLSKSLGMSMVSISAKYGQGYPAFYQEIQKLLADSTASTVQDLPHFLSHEELAPQVDALVKQSVEVPLQLSPTLTHKLDHIFLHRWLGLPIFFFIMYLLFQGIFLLGTPLQDGMEWILSAFKESYLAPLLMDLPKPLQGLLLDGIYDGVGTVATFIPMILLFFLFMTVVEDSGYLSRAAFLMDVLMSKMGLDGRSFVMILMGFGCNVPALMGTRVMQSRRLRLLSMLVIPFALCSARLQVFLFFIATLFKPDQAPLVLLSLYIASFAAAFGTAYLFKGKFSNNEPFILEIPPYRLPTVRHMLLRSWLELQHFIGRASNFIVIGVILVWVLTHFPPAADPASAETLAGRLGNFLAPIFEPIGIEAQLVIALMFGFVAKEIVVGALAVIYGLNDSHLTQAIVQHVDWVQAYSFMLFTLLYSPCLSTVATIRQESQNLQFTVLSLLWSFGLAWGVCFVFYQSARWLMR